MASHPLYNIDHFLFLPEKRILLKPLLETDYAVLNSARSIIVQGKHKDVRFDYVVWTECHHVDYMAHMFRAQYKRESQSTPFYTDDLKLYFYNPGVPIVKS